MAFNNSNRGGNNARSDRFGNPTKLVGCKPNKGGYPVGYIEIGGSTYKLEPGDSNKEGVAAWIRVTKLKPRQRTQW